MLTPQYSRRPSLPLVQATETLCTIGKMSAPKSRCDTSINNTWHALTANQVAAVTNSRRTRFDFTSTRRRTASKLSLDSIATSFLSRVDIPSALELLAHSDNLHERCDAGEAGISLGSPQTRWKEFRGSVARVEVSYKEWHTVHTALPSR